jgi:hypothetical protein
MQDLSQPIITLVFLLVGYYLGWRSKGNMQQKRKPSDVDKFGVVRALKNKVTGPRGAVIRPLDGEDEASKKEKKKRVFFARAQKNPLTKLPDGLDPSDFGIDEEDMV